MAVQTGSGVMKGRAPRNGYEIAIALRADTPFRRELLTLIMQDVALQDFIDLTLDERAQLSYMEQKLLEKSLQEEQEYKADLKRAELVRASAEAQQREYLLPPSEKVEFLLKEIETLTVTLNLLVAEQAVFHQQWKDEHHQSAQAMVDKLVTQKGENKVITLPGGEEVKMTEKNAGLIENLVKALEPVPIGQHCIYNPDLGKHLKECHLQDRGVPDGKAKVDTVMKMNLVFSMMNFARAANELVDGDEATPESYRKHLKRNQGPIASMIEMGMPKNDRVGMMADLDRAIKIDNVLSTLEAKRREAEQHLLPKVAPDHVVGLRNRPMEK